MASAHPNTFSAETAASRVRQNFISAAIAAALLMYFGFSYVLPEGDDLFSFGGRILVCTLRVGGIAMAAAALGSLTGMVAVLMFDAVCSAAIGLFMGIGGGIMISDGGGDWLILLFAVLFLGVGIRSGRDALAMWAARGTMASEGGWMDVHESPSWSAAAQKQDDRDDG